MPCWRQCGSTTANHYHIFWDCPKLKIFWRDIQASLSTVFNTQIPLSFDVLYLGHVPFFECRRKIKQLQILLVASKKSITRRWLSPIQPTLEDWIGIILEIFRMEKLTYQIRLQKDKFYQIWNNWISFIAPRERTLFDPTGNIIMYFSHLTIDWLWLIISVMMTPRVL